MRRLAIAIVGSSAILAGLCVAAVLAVGTEPPASGRARAARVGAAIDAFAACCMRGVDVRTMAAEVRYSAVDPRYAFADLLVSTGGRPGRFAELVLRWSAAEHRWQVIDLGTAEVGCGTLPEAVLAEFYPGAGMVELCRQEGRLPSPLLVPSVPTLGPGP